MIAALALTAALPTLAEMLDHRRVLVVASPGESDPALAAQRRALAGWREGAAERDLSVVEMVGERVKGAGDEAGALRRRFHLPLARFGVVLVGKDGHIALRSDTPLTADRLQAAIDAMPMRRAGLR